jgi:pimeloyl-ACP methyl ester carboxylesterase
MSCATRESSILRAPGAQIYYEVQGSGPVLLMIPGGPADAGIFAGLGRFLADRYTVARYDPRGNSRSILDGTPEDQRMDLHGDDAAQLLGLLSEQPAYVLGSSGGGQIGLNLAARYPQLVHTLVAHEPPCMHLLPDPAEQRTFTESVSEAYRTGGAGPAMQKFLVGTGMAGGRQLERPTPPSLPSAELEEAYGRMQGNLDYFFAHGIQPISLYVPDVALLRAGSPRIVIGVGETSSGQLAYRCAIALADLLGTAPVSFPGGHAGYADQPAAFAERLDQVLLGMASPSTQA